MRSLRYIKSNLIDTNGKKISLLRIDKFFQSNERELNTCSLCGRNTYNKTACNICKDLLLS